jgi:hypothetical protein
VHSTSSTLFRRSGQVYVDHDFVPYLKKSKESAISILTQAVRGLEEEISDRGELATGPIETWAGGLPAIIHLPDQSKPESAPPPPRQGPRRSGAPTIISPAYNRKVFIVHGREEGPREAVARFLERLGFQPIILHEQANQGRTVIEKVEDHGDVGFAVIILTADDMGNVKGEEPQPRARQNVLLELGYFIGKLTRKRVCTLKVGELEIPSDWRGVVDEPYDTAGGWKQTLARELAAADYEIDWNRAMRP